MAGENLIWTIGANAAPFRGELKLAQEQLKQLGRQISAAIKKGDVALAESLSKQYGTLEDRIVGANRALRGTAGALDQVTAAGRRTEVQFRRISLSANSFGRLVSSFGGGFAGGLVGAAVIGGLRTMTKELDDQIERITKIRDLARETARSPASVEAAQRIGRAAGESEDAINAAIKKQAANFEELEKRRIGRLPDQSREAQAAREELIRQRARLLGTGPIAQRGGEKDAALDLSKLYEILIVDVARFKGDAAAASNFIDQSFLTIVKNGKLSAAQLNAIAKELYGISAPAALKLATENIQKYNTELANTKNTTDQAVADAEKLAAAQGKLENQYNESTAGITSAYTQLKTAIAEASTQILKEGVQGTLKREGERQIQDAENQKDANILIWNTLADAAIAAGKKIKDAFGSFGAGGAAFGDPSIPAMPATPIKDEFEKLPPLFKDITDTIGNLWDGLWKHLSISAQAAELSTAKSAQAIGKSFVQAAAAAQGAINTIQGALNMAQGASQLASSAAAGAAGAADKFGVAVSRGGTGFPSPYGPVDTGAYGYGPRGSGFRETASPSRGGDPREGGTSPYLQSYAPGMSNYQALPPHMVSPIDYSEAMGWGSAIRDATEAAKEAAQASQQAAEASKTAADAWVDQVNRVGFGGFASGGMVTGPGSGTSDSIMARLSNGEFVMRAAAVRNLGAGFLSNLNRFAGGGMVMPSRGVPRFAEGGLVTAGAAGAPVHLHLGGHSFALSGSTGVVEALVVEARRQQVRSAGVKPSWYGGRPGGH